MHAYVRACHDPAPPMLSGELSVRTAALHAHTHTKTHPPIHKLMYAYTDSCTHTQTHALRHKRMHSYTNSCTHSHTDAYTLRYWAEQSRAPSFVSRVNSVL